MTSSAFNRSASQLPTPQLSPPDSPRLILGDWLVEATRLAPASVDLLYADPPFNTGLTRTTPPNASRRRPPFAVASASRGAFADAWPSPAAHVAWLRERLIATLPSLRPAASILLHVDWRSAHHVRLLLDDLLGPHRFVNHLIWSYALGGSSPRRFPRKHDDILFYSLDPARCYFDPPRVPATSRRLAGRSKKMTDVLNIPSINNMARERTGYPTQKPLALLELLVRACSPPGGLVLDPCFGSGTTLLAARTLERRAVGFDTNPDAVRIARARLP